MPLTDSQTACLENLKTLNDKNQLEGIHYDVPIEVYHHPECPGFSKTDLMYAAKTYDHLAAYKAGRLIEDDKETPTHFKIGNAVECAMFEPDKFGEKFVRMVAGEPKVDRRTKEGKAVYAEWHSNIFLPWQSDVGDRTILDDEEMDQTLVMSQAGLAHDGLKMILPGAKVQATIFYNRNGVMLKTRPDVFNEKFRVCYDHKTTKDATRAAFSKQVANLKYHMQGAMQIDGLKSVFGQTFDFLLGAHEKPLGGLQIFSVDEYNLDVGRALYHRTVDYMGQVKEGKAPKGFPIEIVPLGLPAWAFDIESQ